MAWRLSSARVLNGEKSLCVLLVFRPRAETVGQVLLNRRKLGAKPG